MVTEFGQLDFLACQVRVKWRHGYPECSFNQLNDILLGQGNLHFKDCAFVGAFLTGNFGLIDCSVTFLGCAAIGSEVDSGGF